jgi:hypothetical protein
MLSRRLALTLVLSLAAPLAAIAQDKAITIASTTST